MPNSVLDTIPYHPIYYIWFISYNSAIKPRIFDWNRWLTCWTLYMICILIYVIQANSTKIYSQFNSSGLSFHLNMPYQYIHINAIMMFYKKSYHANTNANAGASAHACIIYWIFFCIAYIGRRFVLPFNWIRSILATEFGMQYDRNSCKHEIPSHNNNTKRKLFTQMECNIFHSLDHSLCLSSFSIEWEYAWNSTAITCNKHFLHTIWTKRLGDVVLDELFAIRNSAIFGILLCSLHFSLVLLMQQQSTNNNCSSNEKNVLMKS